MNGQTGSGATPSFTFPVSGVYPVTLTVTDDRNGSASITHTVTINLAPTALIGQSCTDLHCDFSGVGSTDPENDVLSYAWSFGDGQSAVGSTAPHDYAAGGSYQVTLTVTDPFGNVDCDQVTVVVLAANQLPTAAFTFGCSSLACTFDGSGSSDPDGTIQSYAWTFMNGQTGSGATPSFTFPVSGVYRVTLPVTDDRHGTATIPHPVTNNLAPQALKHGRAA